MHALGAINVDYNAITIVGKITGAEQKALEWKPEQLEVIKKVGKSILRMNIKTSVMDRTYSSSGATATASMSPGE